MIRPLAPRQAPQITEGSAAARREPSGPAFDQVLRDRLVARVRFSHHAQERLASRGVSLGPDQMRQLETAITLARQKGARDALVLLDQRAFIVSVPTGTVVTAMPAERERVFTNIDSAIVM